MMSGIMGCDGSMWVYQPVQHEAGRAMVGSTIDVAKNCRIGQRPQFQVSACVVCRTDYQTCTPTPGIIVSTPPSSALAPHIVLAELGKQVWDLRHTSMLWLRPWYCVQTCKQGSWNNSIPMLVGPCLCPWSCPSDIYPTQCLECVLPSQGISDAFYCQNWCLC